MPRITTPEAEALLDVDVPVLDKGFVRLIDYMGGDERVVSAARVSYGNGTKTVREDKGLINYLMRNQHTSPFEQVSLVFHIKLPIFVFAQMVRHRTAKLNSMSARYSVMEDEFYLPEAEQWRAQSEANKQVGEGNIETPYLVTDWFKTLCADAYKDYEGMLANGVAREQARMILPQNLYTQIYWKCDLHNLFHFLRLRLDWHAQEEIRAFAEPVAQAAKAVAPLCYEAWEEHIKDGQRFSRSEMAALRAMLEVHSYVGEPGMSPMDMSDLFAMGAEKAGLNERQVAEFRKKIA